MAEAVSTSLCVKRTRKRSPCRLTKDSSLDVVFFPPELKRQTLMAMNDVPSTPFHCIASPLSSQVLSNPEYVVSSPSQFVSSTIATPPSNPTPNHTTTTTSTNVSNVVDLTEENEDDVIDLTATTPVATERQASTFNFRPSCRYATVPVASSPDVMFLSRTGSNFHTTPIARRSKKSKLKGSHNKAAPSPVVLLDSQTPQNERDLSTIRCPVCLETLPQFQKNGSKLVSTICGHIFCSQCLRNSITTMHKCPTCRKKLTLKQYHQIFL